MEKVAEARGAEREPQDQNATPAADRSDLDALFTPQRATQMRSSRVPPYEEGVTEHPYRARPPEVLTMPREAHSLLEELAIPTIFLSLAALLALTTLAGGHLSERGGGVGVVAFAFGGWAFVEAWRVRRRWLRERARTDEDE